MSHLRDKKIYQCLFCIKKATPSSLCFSDNIGCCMCMIKEKIKLIQLSKWQWNDNELNVKSESATLMNVFFFFFFMSQLNSTVNLARTFFICPSSSVFAQFLVQQ